MIKFVAALIAEDGKVVTGQHHGECFSKLSASEQEHEVCSGFLDQEHGKFVTDDAEFYLKKIILVRHAESQGNGPLTERGHRQATQTAAFLNRLDLQGYQFFSSPRRRCVETSTIFSFHIRCDFAVDYNLDEQIDFESSEKFMDRIHHALDCLPDKVVLITHCDVIRSLTVLASGFMVTFPDCIPNCSLTYIDNHRPVWVAREVNSEVHGNGTC